MAEQTTFIRGFLRGTASHESYLQLITDLLPVYEAMESEMESLIQSGSSDLVGFYMPEIARAKSIRSDINYLSNKYLKEEQAHPEPSAASLTYSKRIREVAHSSSPIRIVGHLYTRYLGDLSGGQILARIARNSMQLNEGKGLDFYAFRHINSIAETKQHFRSALDVIGGNKANEDMIIEEAILSFRYNIAIFDTLRGNGLLSIWRNLAAFFRRDRHLIPVADSASL